MQEIEKFIADPKSLEISQKYDLLSTLFSKVKSFSSFDEFYVEGFDENQIWEQIEIINKNVLEETERLLNEGQADGKGDSDQELSEEMADSEEDEMEFNENKELQEELLEEDEEIEEFSEEEIDQEAESGDNEQEIWKPKHKSVVDDEFFSLEEMNRFADLSEKQDMKIAKRLENQDGSDSEEDGMFSVGRDLVQGSFEDIDEDNANDIRYEDFFGPKTGKNTAETRPHEEEITEEEENQEDSEDDIDLLDDVPKQMFEESETEEPNSLSTHEKLKLARQKEIKKLEAELVGEKDWTLKGEVSTAARPINSLLEHDLDVEIAARPVPVITEETTASIEELVIQRIKDKAYDDVVRKVAPNNRFDVNRRFELDDEKSKKSLSQLYEEDYKKKTQTEAEFNLSVSHSEIKELFGELCHTLDALTNWHYTPEPIQQEIKVISNVSTIANEEVIPISVNDGALLAPGEVYAGKVRKAQGELDAHEKKKLRRKERRKVGLKKKAREIRMKESEEARGVMSKERAMKQLMGEKNVTLVVDGRKHVKKGQKIKAGVVEKGGNMIKAKAKVSGSSLML